jgi:hypothetical protein
MKYFLDTEFIEDGKTIDLISIGIVAEDGREFYKLNSNCDFSKASEWVKENVFPHIPLEFNEMAGRWVYDWTKVDNGKEGFCCSRVLLASQIRKFIGDDPTPEFWGYYADYDWVVFCQLFGTMMDLPKGFPMYCCDIKQLNDSMGNRELPKQEGTEHHALADARWNQKAWQFLNECDL